MEFKQGQILNFSYNNIYDKLIKFGTKSKWSHSAIVGKSGTIDCFVYEALNGGFVGSWYNCQKLEEEYNKGNLAIGTTIEQLDNVELNCQKYVGTPYGWQDIFTIALYILTGDKALESQDTRNLICSEAVAKILYDCSKSINLQTEFNKPYSYITPADLFNSKQITWQD